MQYLSEIRRQSQLQTPGPWNAHTYKYNYKTYLNNFISIIFNR